MKNFNHMTRELKNMETEEIWSIMREKVDRETALRKELRKKELQEI